MANKSINKKVIKKVFNKDTVTESAVALPEGEAVPEGFEKIGGGYAPSWKPEEMRVLHGTVTGGVREVKLTIGHKKQTSRCLEVTRKKSGERLTVWESTVLTPLFDQIATTGEGPEVFLRFEGLGKKKKGQHPVKLITAAVKE